MPQVRSRQPSESARDRSRRVGTFWRPFRRGALLLLLLLLIAFGVALGVSYYYLTQGVTSMRVAAADIQALRSGAGASHVIRRAQRHVARAEVDFASARRWLDPLAPVLAPLALLPGPAPTLSAAPALARTAQDAAAGTSSLLTALVPVANDVQRKISVPVLVKALASAHAPIASACVSLRSASADARALTPKQLAALGRRASKLIGAIRQMDGGCHALLLLPTLLGVHTPQTYLVAYQDTQELKATGGFMGSLSLVTVKDGVPNHRFSGAWLNHQNLSIPPPDPMLVYNDEPAWLFMDSNWSPNFPTSAALERYFARLDMGLQVQGVINVSPQAVQDILRALGPVHVPEYHITVTAANVVTLADYYTHWTPHSGPKHFSNEDTQRQQFIGIVANHIFARLSTASPRQMYRLVTAVQHALSLQTLLLNFTNPAAQRLLTREGLSGRIDPWRGDYLYVVDTNLSYNKINPYISETVHYHTHIQPNGWLHSSLTIHLHNTPSPHHWRDAYGPGAGTLGGWDDYADYIRIYVPLGSQVIAQSGWYQPWTPGNAYGKTELSGYVIVRRGQSRTITVSYVVPPNVWDPTGGKSYVLRMQHQPGSTPKSWSVVVTGPTGASRSWSVANPQSELTVEAPYHPASFAPIPLPSAPVPAVAPGAVIEPHALLRAAR